MEGLGDKVRRSSSVVAFFTSALKFFKVARIHHPPSAIWLVRSRSIPPQTSLLSSGIPCDASIGCDLGACWMQLGLYTSLGRRPLRCVISTSRSFPYFLASIPPSFFLSIFFTFSSRIADFSSLEVSFAHSERVEDTRCKLSSLFPHYLFSSFWIYPFQGYLLEEVQNSSTRLRAHDLPNEIARVTHLNTNLSSHRSVEMFVYHKIPAVLVNTRESLLPHIPVSFSIKDDPSGGYKEVFPSFLF